jgi:glycosidase
MIDLPSCISVDLYEKRPDLAAIDSKGFPKVPQGWEDIRMMEPWADEDKRVLNKALLDEHKQWIDLIQDLGVDGVRADVGRAKPVEFWNELIPYSRKKDPNFAWLAESYVYEDASPMMNMPYDRPKDLLNVGFDSIYGQYHIFPHMEKAKEFHNYVGENLKMSHGFEPGKSLIGSFATHDDNSPMSNGGVPYCNMTTGIQMTLPMTNPYFVTGFESGDRYIYPYKNTTAEKSMTDSNVRHVNPQWVDIFNLSRKPAGDHPEIGDYMTAMSKIREKYSDVITKGSYIPLEVKNNYDDKIIAYARHYNGKTLLAVANKDVNSKQTGKIIIPGVSAMDDLNDLCPSYGILSGYSARKEAVEVNLGPARFHLFEINTPNIEKDAKEVYKQNL